MGMQIEEIFLSQKENWTCITFVKLKMDLEFSVQEEQKRGKIWTQKSFSEETKRREEWELEKFVQRAKKRKVLDLE